jgi:hypothetical protein
MEARDTAKRMAAYYGKLKQSARKDEEPIVLTRKSREHQIKVFNHHAKQLLNQKRKRIFYSVCSKRLYQRSHPLKRERAVKTKLCVLIDR